MLQGRWHWLEGKGDQFGRGIKKSGVGGKGDQFGRGIKKSGVGGKKGVLVGRG